MKWRRLLLSLPILCAGPARATSALEVGLLFSLDQGTHSVREAYGVVLGLRNTIGQGIFRPHLAIEAFYSDGSLRTGNLPYTATFVGQSTHLGFGIYPFLSDTFSPFLGAGFLGGISLLQVDDPPSSESRTAARLHWGYELAGGARWNVNAKRAISLRGAYRSIQSRYAGTSLQMNNVSLSIGFEF